MSASPRALLGFALLCSLLCLQRGPILLVGSDSWFHVAQIEQLARTGELLPRGGNGDIQFNAGLWYAPLALACRLLGCSALQLWMVLPVVVAPLLVLAAAWAGRQLLGPGCELAAAAAFMLLLEGDHLDPWRELGYPRYVNWIPFLVALGAAVRYVGEGRPRDLALAAAAGALTALVHLVEWVLFGLLLGFWGLALLALSGAERFRRCGRAIAVGLLTLALGLPYIAFMARSGMPVVEDGGIATGGPERLREILWLSDRFFLLDPGGEFGAICGALGWLAAAGAWVLIPRARNDPATALLFAALIAPPLVVFNPLVLPAFLKVWPAPEVLHRLALIMLVPFGALAVARAAWPQAHHGGLRRLAGGALVVALALAALPVAVRRVASPARAGAELAVVAPWAGALRDLRDRYPATARFLSDPVTSYMLAAFCGFPILDDGTVFHVNQDRRFALPAGALFRNPYQTSREAHAALDARRAQAVVLNEAPAPREYFLRTHRDPYYDAGTRAFFDANPQAFRRVYQRDGFTVYERVAGATGPLAGKDRPFEEGRRSVRAGQRECAPGMPAVPAGLCLTEPVAWKARRGGGVRAELAWAFARPRDAFVKVRIHAINHAPETAGWRREWGKLLRRLAERRDRVRYRFGGDADLVPEEVQQLPFAAGDLVKQEVELPAAADLAPGVYELRAEVLEKGVPERRRLTLSDDPPPGVPIGTLELD